MLPHQCDTTIACYDMRCLLLLKKRNDTEPVPKGLTNSDQLCTHWLSAQPTQR